MANLKHNSNCVGGFFQYYYSCLHVCGNSDETKHNKVQSKAITYTIWPKLRGHLTIRPIREPLHQVNVFIRVVKNNFD